MIHSRAIQDPKVMNATIAKVNKSIWPLNFDQLHRDYYDWMSMLDFWKYEVRYLERAMKRYLAYPLSRQQAGEMREAFNQLMGSIKPEIREIEGWLRSFHRQLARIANPDSEDKNLKNGSEHRRIYRKMDSFRRRLAFLKRQLYQLLIDVIREEKVALLQHRAIWAHPHPYAEQLRQSG